VAEPERVTDEALVQDYTPGAVGMEQGEREAGIHQGPLLPTEVRPVAGPRPGRWVADEVGPNWIEVEVPHEGLKVGISLAQDCLIPRLEQVADPAVAAVEGFGIPGQERLHQVGEGDPVDFQ
jgi:hypothetical protein